MTSMELRERLLDEIQRIPDTRIAEIFDLIHFFRIGLAAAPPVAETTDAMIANLPAVGRICRNGISRHLNPNCNHAAMRHSGSGDQMKPTLIDTDILPLFFRNHPLVVNRFAQYAREYSVLNWSV